MSTFRCVGCGSWNRLPDLKPAEPPHCGRCRAALDAEGAPQEVTARQFEDTIGSSPVPVLVDFWASWCGPCRAAAPILDAIARANVGRILIVCLNTDENHAIAERYRIASVPSFFIFKNGQLLARQSGLPPRDDFERWVKSFIP